MHAIKNNKAPGCDGIPIELLKASGDQGIQFMSLLCQKVWETEIWPLDWKKSAYIPKTGDFRECANNRTIALI